MNNHRNLLAKWTYSEKEWNEFVTIEKANKKEDNIYFGIGILILGTIGLMFLRQTGFLIGVLFSAPLAVLIPWLRFKFSYPHLKKNKKDPYVKIYNDFLEINNHNIDLSGKRKRIKSVKIIGADNQKKLLEFDVQWITAKGPTNDEFRILIPKDKTEEAMQIIKSLN